MEDYWEPTKEELLEMAYSTEFAAEQYRHDLERDADMFERYINEERK